MRYVSASDAKQRFGVLLDAAQREPVTIKRQNREVAVIISPQDYQHLRGANIEEFQRLCQRIAKKAAERGMNEEILAQILKD